MQLLSPEKVRRIQQDLSSFLYKVKILFRPLPDHLFNSAQTPTTERGGYGDLLEVPHTWEDLTVKSTPPAHIREMLGSPSTLCFTPSSPQVAGGTNVFCEKGETDAKAKGVKAQRGTRSSPQRDRRTEPQRYNLWCNRNWDCLNGTLPRTRCPHKIKTVSLLSSSSVIGRDVT